VSINILRRRFHFQPLNSFVYFSVCSFRITSGKKTHVYPENILTEIYFISKKFELGDNLGLRVTSFEKKGPEIILLRVLEWTSST
jgi:hypothetical protein